MRKFLAICFFMIIVFPVLFASFLGLGLSTWILDRDFYKDAFANVEFEQTLRQELTNQVLFGAAGPERSGLGSDESVALQAALADLIPENYLSETSGQVIDRVFDLLEGRTTEYDIVIDLRPIKANVDGAKSAAFAAALIDTLPACREGQDPYRSTSSDSGDLTTALPVCRPNDIPADELQGRVTTAVMDGLMTMDNEIVLPDPLELSSVPPGITGLISIGFVTAFLSILSFGLFMWLLDALLWGRTRRGRMLWLSFSLAVPASIIALLGLVMVFAPFSASFINMLDFALPSGQRTVETFFRTVFPDIGRGWLIAGGIPLLVAVVLFALGLGMRGRSDDDSDDYRSDDYLDVRRREKNKRTVTVS